MTPANQLLERIEAGRLWAYFHKDWLLQIRGLIRPQLPSEFSVFVESEVVLIAPAEFESVTTTAFDLAVARAESGDGHVGEFGRPTTAVIKVEEPCELFHQYRLVIRRVPDNQVVAAAELLSPTNKGTFGELEKNKYLRKREQYLDAGVNLLEIDALRGGDRLLPRAAERLADYDRNAWSVSHDSDRRRYRGWGWNNADPLPTVTWPIEPSRQVIVDLAEAFRQACEFNPWERLVADG
ncbi:MAG: DUF4058 family protein [Planctomycetaceae bacterium]